LETAQLPEKAQAQASDEQRLRNLAANLLFGLALVDGDLRLLRSNRKFHSFFPIHKPGLQLCDVLQRECAGRPGLDPENYAQGGCLNCPATRCLQEGQNFEREFVRQTPGGQEQHFRFVCYPASGPASGLALVLVEDVTRKRLLEKKLLRAQRLEAMSSLAGGIAHEINQPLSALNLYASGLQILLDKPELPPAQVLRERVGLILDQARKISEITRHMRAMGTQSAAASDQVDVREALDAALQPLQDKLRAADIRLELRSAMDAAGRVLPLPPVKAIAVQLNQVFTNLINNAMQAIIGGRDGKDKKPGLIRISARAEGDRVLLELADNGPGMPPGLERRVFDPFFSTKGPDDGLGLGLSVTHAFVSSWGGEIQAQGKHPELGGAMFSLILRVAE
jgi:signal transduction histidine kinase